MSRKYNSAISWWLAVFVLLILFGTSILFIIEKAWVGLLINVPLILWLLHMGYNTYYVIDSGILYITCGLFYKDQFLITDIMEVRSTNHPFSSPALSMDRLEIKLTNRKTVMISPKHKNEFVQELTKWNSSIKIKW